MKSSSFDFIAINFLVVPIVKQLQRGCCNFHYFKNKN